MPKFEFFIKDYFGIVDDGILVIITIRYSDTLFEGTFWYNIEGNRILVFEEELENILGSKIEEDILYNDYIELITSKVGKFEDLVDKLPVISTD